MHVIVQKYIQMHTGSLSVPLCVRALTRKAVPEMTYTGGTLNPTHSHTEFRTCTYKRL